MASRPVLEAFEAKRIALEPKPAKAAAAAGGAAGEGGGAWDDPRVARAVALRRLLSPAEMLRDDGTIDQDFFKPKQVIIVEDKKWGPAERDALYKGLETFGVGGWRSIVDTLLPRWEETALRVKAGRLMGTQSLARYVGWKGNREAVDAEFAKNKELGEATGCWKGGVLVEDDAGSVAAELTRRAAAAAVAAAAGAGK